jgi:hypothetical protein
MLKPVLNGLYGLIRCNEPAPCNAHVDPAHRNVDVDFYDIFRQVVWLARQVL